jgi:hypothetical protein
VRQVPVTEPEDRASGIYEGRFFGDPDDGTGATCFVGGERLFEVEIETIPDVLGEL